MQIISGKFKNSPILSPNDEKTHPMGSREKLALFNSLISHLESGSFDGLKVLDAFAGTGALGLEALSRGAVSVVFVEKSPKIAKILEKNLKNVLLDHDLIKNQKILVSDVKNLKKADFDGNFDLIFADPPYDFYSEAIISPLVVFLAPRAVLALSLPKSAPTPVFEGLTPVSEKTYASAKIILFQNS